MRLSEFLVNWQGGEVGGQSGTEEMLEMVDRYSVLGEHITTQLNGATVASKNSFHGEVVSGFLIYPLSSS
jgi:hypothetical protein